MRRVVWVLLVLVAGVAAWVRLAPTDAALWHQDPATDAAPDGVIRTEPGGARLACLLPGAPAAVLGALDAKAMASARTRRIAGDPASGMITWETRSLVWGFPDYTTARAVAGEGGTRLDLHARLRFGASDLGVNAARLRRWQHCGGA